MESVLLGHTTTFFVLECYQLHVLPYQRQNRRGDDTVEQHTCSITNHTWFWMA